MAIASFFRNFGKRTAPPNGAAAPAKGGPAVQVGGKLDHKGQPRQPDPSPPTLTPLYERKARRAGREVELSMLRLITQSSRAANISAGQASRTGKALTATVNEAARQYRTLAFGVLGHQANPTALYALAAKPGDARFAGGSHVQAVAKQHLGRLGLVALRDVIEALNVQLKDHKGELTEEAVLFCTHLRDWASTAQSNQVDYTLKYFATSEQEPASWHAKALRLAAQGSRSTGEREKDHFRLAALRNDIEGVAKLPVRERGDLKRACLKLFGLNATKELFVLVDQHRLKDAQGHLKEAVSALHGAPGDRVRRMQLAGWVYSINRMEEDAGQIGATGQMLTEHFCDVPAFASMAGNVVDRLAEGRAERDDRAVTAFEPVFQVLAKLPKFDAAVALQKAMAPRLETLDLAALDRVNKERVTFASIGTAMAHVNTALESGVVACWRKEQLVAAKTRLIRALTPLYDSPTSLALQEQVKGCVQAVAACANDAKATGPTAEAIAKHFAESPKVEDMAKALVDHMRHGDSEQSKSAIAAFEPICKALEALPGFSGAEALRLALWPRLERLDNAAWARVEAQRSALSTDTGAAPGYAPKWINIALKQALPVGAALARLTSAMDDAKPLFEKLGRLQPHEEADARDAAALVAITKRLGNDVTAHTNTQVSASARTTLTFGLEEVREQLDKNAGTIMRHMALLDLAECESLCSSFKALRPLSDNFKRALDNHLRSRMVDASNAWTKTLTRAVNALSAPAIDGDADPAEQAVKLLDDAMEQERATQRLGNLFDCPDFPHSPRAHHMQVALAASSKQKVPEHVQQSMRDVAALLRIRPRQPAPVDGPNRSPLESRLDAISEYLRAIQAARGIDPNGVHSRTPDRAQQIFKDQLRIDWKNGTPIDVRGLGQFVQSTMQELLDKAIRTAPPASNPPVVAPESAKDLSRLNLNVRQANGTFAALNNAVAVSGVQDNKGATVAGQDGASRSAVIAKELHTVFGGDSRRLWINSKFLTGDLVGVIVGDYLKTDPDNPIARRFGPAANVTLGKAGSSFFISPGQSEHTFKLTYVEPFTAYVHSPPMTASADEPTDEEEAAAYVDLDVDKSAVRIEIEFSIDHTQGQLTVTRAVADMELVERSGDARGAAQLYIETLAPAGGSLISRIKDEEQDAIRRRALVRLNNYVKPVAQTRVENAIDSLLIGSPSSRAKAVLVQEINKLDPERRQRFLKAAAQDLTQYEGGAKPLPTPVVRALQGALSEVSRSST